MTFFSTMNVNFFKSNVGNRYFAKFITIITIFSLFLIVYREVCERLPYRYVITYSSIAYQLLHATIADCKPSGVDAIMVTIYGKTCASAWYQKQ